MTTGFDESRYTRVYTPGGVMAHLLRDVDSPNSPAPALCGRSPGFLTDWHGTGTQREHETAATRNLCTRCAVVAKKRNR